MLATRSIWPAAEPKPHDPSVSKEPFAFRSGIETYMSGNNDLNVTVTPLVSFQDPFMIGRNID